MRGQNIQHQHCQNLTLHLTAPPCTPPCTCEVGVGIIMACALGLHGLCFRRVATYMPMCPSKAFPPSTPPLQAPPLPSCSPLPSPPTHLDVRVAIRGVDHYVVHVVGVVPLPGRQATSQLTGLEHLGDLDAKPQAWSGLMHVMQISEWCRVRRGACRHRNNACPPHYRSNPHSTHSPRACRP